MRTAKRRDTQGPADRGAGTSLPDYTAELDAFHRAFAPELRGLVRSLPLNPQARVLDVCCGDGFYMELFAERLHRPGRIVGLDVNPACLDRARERLDCSEHASDVEFIASNLDDTWLIGDYDLVWCAQSLYSLPDPVSALRKMASAVRAGGLVVVLENDTLHQLLLPWPDHLEIAVRLAEVRSLSDESPRSDRFYVGHRLPEVLEAAGLESLGFRTQCIDRHSPFDSDLRRFLEAYLSRLRERAIQHLSAPLARKLVRMTRSDGSESLFCQPTATVSWLNMLAWGRLPRGRKRDHVRQRSESRHVGRFSTKVGR